MRTLHKFFFGLCFLSTLAAISMISSANSSRTHFNAFCDGLHGLTVGWYGPDRFTYDEALKDAQNHHHNFPTHMVGVFTND